MRSRPKAHTRWTGPVRPAPLISCRCSKSPCPLFPQYEGKLNYAPGAFPRAEEFHRNTLKLPVWHQEEDMPLIDSYIEAFRKVTDHYRDLLR